MDALSTLIISNPNKTNRSLSKTTYSTILYITFSIATFASLLLLHRYSPCGLWLTANAIVFSVYKLSSSADPSHSDHEPDPQPIIAPLPSDTWLAYSSPCLAEPEPAVKEVIHVDTVGEEEVQVAKEETMDDTWKTIMMWHATDAARVLKKSDTWERTQPHLRKADEVGPKPELTKSATYTEGREKSTSSKQQEEEKANKGDAGWRRREVLVVANDELFRRVENFIKEQHDNLRLQRQESEYRRFLEHFRK